MQRLLLAGTLMAISCAPALGAQCPAEMRVRQIVAEEYGKKPSQVSLDDKVAVDGPHTIEDVEIKLMVEEKFGLKIPDADWAKLIRVRDLARYLSAHVNGCS